MLPRLSDAQARLLALVHDRTHERYGDLRFLGSTGVWTHSRESGYLMGKHTLTTLTVCVRLAWVDMADDGQGELTASGLAALEAWRARKLAAPAPPPPRMTDREREIAEIAQRALDLGYAISPLKATRTESNRMRRAGWFRHCWLANRASGLVPTALAVVEVRPEQADGVVR